MEASWPNPTACYQAETQHHRRDSTDPMITDDDYHSILRSGYASNSYATLDESKELPQESLGQTLNTTQSEHQAIGARRGPVGDHELSFAAFSFLWDDPSSSPISFEAPPLEESIEASPPTQVSSRTGQAKPRPRRRYDPREWEERRPAITNLYQNHSLLETMKLMEDQHQFFASYVEHEFASDQDTNSTSTVKRNIKRRLKNGD